MFFARKQIGLVFRLNKPKMSYYLTDCWTNDEIASKIKS